MSNRRKFLQGCGFCLLAAISGCSTIASDPPSKTTISQIYIDNIDDRQHTVPFSSTIRSRKPVYLQSRTFEANDPSEEYKIGGGSFEGLPEGPRNYQIWIRLDQRGWKVVDVDGYEDIPDRVSIRVIVGYQRKESGPPAWKVTMAEAEK